MLKIVYFRKINISIVFPVNANNCVPFLRVILKLWSSQTARTLFSIIFGGLTSLGSVEGQTNLNPTSEVPETGIETIVCIRHAEKPPGGLGQLNCQGLNRALALPNVLLGKYGKPQFIFAPDPAHKEHQIYNYIRPLVTIEPTAILCGLPVNTDYGDNEIKGLEQELEGPKYQNATIFIAWEHELLDRFVKNLLKDNGGDPAQVPDWPGNDFDSIFVVKITRQEKKTSVIFLIDHEKLNGLSSNCP